MLAAARAGGYALGYFEAWDQTSFEAVIAACERAQAPAILGWGGAITSYDWLESGGIEQQAGIAMALAERATVPCAVMFNEAKTLAHLERALALGANAVMLDISHLEYAENLASAAALCQLAHPLGAAVEAELGRLGDASDPNSVPELTDPVQAAEFVAASGVDALAVSVGNVHVMTAGESGVDLERLAAIAEAVDVPLVIHGGSGYPAWAVREAIARGVCKFNVGTRLKGRWLRELRAALSALPEALDIQQTVGSRNRGDVLERVREGLIAEILHMLELYGAAGRVS